MVYNGLYMKCKALERAGKVDRINCCVQTDHTKDLISALFFIYGVNYWHGIKTINFK